MSLAFSRRRRRRAKLHPYLRLVSPDQEPLELPREPGGFWLGWLPLLLMGAVALAEDVWAVLTGAWR